MHGLDIFHVIIYITQVSSLCSKKVTITGNKETALGTVTVNWDNVEIKKKKKKKTNEAMITRKAHVSP